MAPTRKNRVISSKNDENTEERPEGRETRSSRSVNTSQTVKKVTVTKNKRPTEKKLLKDKEKSDSAVIRTEKRKAVVGTSETEVKSITRTRKTRAALRDVNNGTSEAVTVQPPSIEETREACPEDEPCNEEPSDPPQNASTVKGTDDSSKRTTARSFYGSKHESGLLEPQKIQQRLNELSFTARKSFVPTPEAVNRIKKRAIARSRQQRATKQPKHKWFEQPKKKLKPVTCCSRKAPKQSKELKDMSSTVLNLSGSMGSKSLTKKKFFKHHIPANSVKVYFKGGDLVVAPHTPSTKKGLIDFDFKDNNISHVAEEGGKCDSFGLQSMDDLERTGIPRVNILNTSIDAPGLRKRKSQQVTPTPAKRRRPSDWRYAEDTGQAGTILSGPSIQQYEEAQLREKYGFKAPLVKLRRMQMPKPPRQRKSPRKTLNLTVDASIVDIPSIVVVDSKDEPDVRPAERAESKREMEIPSREPTPSFLDLADDRDSSPEICPSPAFSDREVGRSPSPMPVMETPIEKTCKLKENGRVKKKRDAVPEPPPKTVEVPYNPFEDAFGFDRVTPKLKYESPFLRVLSPTKCKPKALTPKPPKANTRQQLSIKQALDKSSTSTPFKRVSTNGPTPILNRLPAEMTSTPWESDNRVKNFYGGVSGSSKKDGFSGLRRLIDRLGERQLQIDAGQSKYGAKECQVCGMVFSQGEAQDEKDHEKFHKQFLVAIQYKGWRNGRVIDVVPEEGKVFLLTAQDPKTACDRVNELLRFANKCTGFDEQAIKVDFETHPDRKFLIFITHTGKIIAIVGTEPCERAFRTMDGERFLIDDKQYFSVEHSIFFMWTLTEYRRRGFASLLLFHVRSLLAGPDRDPLDFDEIAFSDVTPDLQHLVTALSGKETFLIAAL